MPLTPAIRPLTDISMTAATPIKAPPISEAIGVKDWLIMETNPPIRDEFRLFRTFEYTKVLTDEAQAPQRYGGHAKRPAGEGSGGCRPADRHGQCEAAAGALHPPRGRGIGGRARHGRRPVVGRAVPASRQ